MKITEDLEFKAELLKKIAEREFGDRTGIHQSDLNYCLNKQVLRKLHPKDTEEHALLLFSFGWATQRWLTGQDEDEPEREVDGIIVTLDAIHNGIPWELKCTYQSSTRPIVDNAHWIRQIMAQCYVTGSTSATLSRLEVMGDWQSVFPKGKDKEEKQQNKALSKKPTLHTYKLEFSQEELDRNWVWFINRRELYKGILRTGKLIPKAIAIPQGQEWECSWCSYKEECDAN